MDADKLEELERLLAGLRAIVASYEKKNPLRTADFHGEGCGCYRCAVDGCSAAINALEELVAMGRAFAIYDKNADDCIHRAMFSDKQTMVTGIEQAQRRARAALKGPTT